MIRVSTAEIRRDVSLQHFGVWRPILKQHLLLQHNGTYRWRDSQVLTDDRWQPKTRTSVRKCLNMPSLSRVDSEAFWKFTDDRGGSMTEALRKEDLPKCVEEERPAIYCSQGTVLSCPVLSRPILCCSVLFCPVPSYSVLPCPIPSSSVLFCLFPFYPVPSYSVLSCPILFCPVPVCGQELR